MKKYILLAVILLAGALGAWFFFSADSDAAQIKRTLQMLCRMTTKKTGDNAAAAALLISKTDKVFTGEFSVKIGNGMLDGVYNPTKMTSELARYRGVFKEVRTDIQDVEINFPAPDAAEVVFTGVLNGSSKTGSSVSEAREVICTFTRTPEGWRINKMVIREIMEK